jgi:hypothetical protein
VDSAVGKDCGEIRITLYPVGRDGPYPNSSCTGEGKAAKRRDPSEKAGWLGPWMRAVTRLSFVMSAIIVAAVHRLGRSTAPVGTTPVSRYRHSATISLRATATMAMRRMRPLMSPTRWWNQRVKSLSG